MGEEKGKGAVGRDEVRRQQKAVKGREKVVHWKRGRWVGGEGERAEEVCVCACVDGWAGQGRR